MQIRELSIPDAYEITPIVRGDDRGVFLEWYRFDKLSEVTGHPIVLRQANTSVSKKGVVRGIHFADFPIGQAKYVTCVAGSVLDVIIDIRVGSPTFGQWDSVVLDDESRSCVFLSEGLGHLFVATSDSATVSYLTTDKYRPGAEHGINPADPALGLELPEGAIMSARDVAAPTLADALAAGLLPTFDASLAAYAAARTVGSGA